MSAEHDSDLKENVVEILLKPGVPVSIRSLMAIHGLPDLYFVLLDRSRSEAVIAIGPKSDQAS
jgi:hypothetical protein